MSCSEQNSQIRAVSRNLVSVGTEGNVGSRKGRDTEQAESRTQEDKVTLSVDVTQHFFPNAPVVAQWTHG